MYGLTQYGGFFMKSALILFYNGTCVKSGIAGKEF